MPTQTPRPGPASDPAIKVRYTYGVIYVIAAVNLLIGAASFLFQADFLLTPLAALIAITYGLIFMLLGYYVRRRSMLALYLALTLFGVDTLYDFGMTIASGAVPATSSIIFRGFLLIVMVQGIRPLKELNQRR